MTLSRLDSCHGPNSDSVALIAKFSSILLCFFMMPLIVMLSTLTQSKADLGKPALEIEFKGNGGIALLIEASLDAIDLMAIQ